MPLNTGLCRVGATLAEIDLRAVRDSILVQRMVVNDYSSCDWDRGSLHRNRRRIVPKA